MRKWSVLWVIAALLAGTSICMAANNMEKKVCPKKESAAKEAHTANVPRAYLGLEIEALHPALASHLPGVIPSGHGILIARVLEGSPAAKAGLKNHDIVISYGEHKVRSPEEFVNLVHGAKPGQEVALHILRAGKPEQITVKLGEMKAGETSVAHRGMRPLIGERREHASAPKNKEALWNTFDSMNLTRLDANRFRAEIKYRDTAGKIDTRVFEGTREELRNKIESAKDMPRAERGHLLSALDMPGAGFEFGPSMYLTPGGEMVWDFGGVGL